MENENMLCDFCEHSHEGIFFTPQRDFEIIDIVGALEVISHKKLPYNLDLKLCLLCSAQLISTKWVVEKTQKMVEKLMKDQFNAENENMAAKEEKDGKNPKVEVTASTSVPKKLTIPERIPFVKGEAPTKIKKEQPDEEPSTSMPKKPKVEASEDQKIIIKKEEPDQQPIG